MKIRRHDMSDKEEKPKWLTEIEKIVEAGMPDSPEEEEDDFPASISDMEKQKIVDILHSLGFEVMDSKNVLQPDKVAKFMQYFNQKNNEGVPSVRFRHFFEALIRQFTYQYPAKEAAILSFKAGQIYERYKNDLEK